MAREIYLGPSWATTGAASAGSTGLSSVTGLTHSTTPSRMAGDSASAVLISGVNASCSFRVGPISGANSLFNADPYSIIRFKCRPRIELPGSMTTTDFLVNGSQLANNNSLAITYLSTRYSQGKSGLKLYCQNFAGGGSHIQPPWDMIPFDQWLEWTIRMRKATAGAMEFFLNRFRVSQAVGNYSTFSANMSVAFPAIPGVAWEFGEIEQWSGTDCPMEPLTSAANANDDIIRLWTAQNESVNHPDSAATGSDATITTVSGTPTYSWQWVSNGGNSPLMTFMTVTGSGAVESAEYAFSDMPWHDGWAGFYLPMLYYPSGSSATIDLYRGTKKLMTLAIGSGQVSLNGVNQAAFTAASRNALMFLVSQKGQIDLCTIDQTTTTTNAPYIFAANLPDLPAGLTPDRLVITSTLGASGMQRCGAVLAKTLRMVGVDSMTASPAFSTPIGAPIFQVGNNITGQKHLNEMLGIPGLRPFAEEGENIGRLCCVTAGRSGAKLQEFVTYQLPALSTLRGGVTIDLFEGGINDVSTVTTLAEAATRAAEVLTYDTALKTWASAKPGRRLIMSTLLERSLSTHWSGAPSNTIVGARLSCIRAINAARRSLFSSPTPADRWILADAAAIIRPVNHAAMIDTGNPPHFNYSGNFGYFAAKCAGEMSAVRGAVAKSRVWSEGAIATGTNA